MSAAEFRAAESATLVLITAAPGGVLLGGEAVEVAAVLGEPAWAQRPDVLGALRDDVAVHESGGGYRRDVLYATVPGPRRRVGELAGWGLNAWEITVSPAEAAQVRAAMGQAW